MAPDAPKVPDGWPPEEDLEQAGGVAVLLGRPWQVIVHDDDWHTFEEVILQLQKAVGCNRQDAERMTWEIHNTGRSLVYEGLRAECERVAGVLRLIQLSVEIAEAP